MRRLIVAFALLASIATASADEFPTTLRGSTPYVPAAPTYMRWSGFYAGGQVGYGTSHMDFSGTTREVYAYMLRELALENEQHPSTWKVLGTADNKGGSQGAFIGYNSQWDDIIIGFDMHYSRTNFFASAPSTPIGRRTTAGGNIYDVFLSGSADMAIHDWGAARLRAGYIWDNLLPYATIGFAFGRADISRSASVVGQEFAPPPAPPPPPCVAPNCVPFSYSSSETKKNVWIYGWAAGGGVDILLMPNFFLRGEYEYVSFATVMGTRASISTARLGAAFKY